MKVGFIQYNVSKDIEKNYLKIEDEIKKNEADIIALPELSNCGYLFDNKDELKNVANITNEEYKMSLLNLSKKYKKTIIAGFAELIDDNIYNSALIVSIGKYIGKYQKIHLSDFEKNFFTAGNNNNVFEVNGIKIGIQICFDLWFPEISRWQILNGADLLIVLGNFGGPTTFEIARIRAIENQTPLLLVNRVGYEKNKLLDASFIGLSSIYDKDGNNLVIPIKDKEITNFAEIEIKNKSNIICKDFISEIKKHY